MVSEDFNALFDNVDSFALLELVFNKCYDSVVITKAEEDNHEIVYANPGFCNMTGYTLDELKGKTTSILKGPKTNPDTIARLKQNLREGIPFTGSAVNYKKNKTEYQVEWNIHHIADAQGKPKYYISIQRDLTALKSTLSRLKSTNNEFRAFLKNLTGDSETEQQLTQRKKKAAIKLADDAGLFSPALREQSRTEFFEESELFGFDDGEKGVLPETEAKPVVSAKEYAEQVCLSEYEIQNIQTIIDDLSASVDLLSVSNDQTKAMSNIIKDVQELANALVFIDAFLDMSSVFSELSMQLQQRVNENKDSEFLEFFTSVFESLIGELKHWFNSVFIDCSSENIYSEDASILGSAKQLLQFIKMV